MANLRLALMVLLCFAGFLRISECLNLTPADFSYKEKYLTLLIKNSKTDKFREGQYCHLAYGRISKLLNYF